MHKKRIAILTGVCILLTACGRGGGEKSTISIADTVKAYETISFQEFQAQTGKEAEFYHATRFMGEIPDLSICVIFEGTYDEETAGTVLADGAATAVFERLEGAGTAYYVGDDYVQMQFDGDRDGEYDRRLLISMDEAAEETVSPESPAWLEML